MLHRPLRDALKLIADADHGVAVILRPEESARDLVRAVQSLTTAKMAGASQIQEQMAAAPPEPELGSRRNRGMDFRTFGIGAQIVRALGVRRMRVVGAPKQMHALSGFGLEVVEYVSDATDRENTNG
jgi:3,4-dihydroxy 2-butanone 4-phosphate synthase/GTP cyclohydrolase II